MHRRIPSTARTSFGATAPAFVRYTEEVLFGDVWRRETLSLRDRSLITLSALVSAGLTDQLPYHMRLASEDGLTEEELAEAVTHLAFYAGWPRAASALDIAKTVFGRDK
ncbi:carboxymuconolactone decarboxylase family protein [Paenibacillus sacheonensis]|uniref:Carboxymuconolactone decarboxylase family protein n=1 Tax=Paenibacillus sacheonensis TaxID=742054 RepID=A0A7X4YK32_9BACL|nr:carboxymuconolactone decarboxylase family protein [Paenibacillus sacheonensis]MBM7563916.1 4-carboxymuconolactone decarboxylase [Paenibacillus sacheonensis]NBC67737.1 carboxymuconolactone decarboxylase family protein [Paenibacillus sacheonensis]